MKKTSPQLLALSSFIILLSFISAQPFLASAELVLDSTGEPLQWSNNYYVLPHNWRPPGGGLSLGTHNNNSCPHYVTQERSEVATSTFYESLHSLFYHFLYVLSSISTFSFRLLPSYANVAS
ncbi:Kunitz-type trypsin inhibitor [Quillaja saponaria]|uniref:Kunitz-type trypsin inhibitor n=1 Tax=Quillaja saponaria TaxID=32244 RepID=A0AAD7VGX2_QUISA|nr:Kunitz-type trypsin inhibitor [Quillaja saponaria]